MWARGGRDQPAYTVVGVASLREYVCVVCALCVCCGVFWCVLVCSGVYLLWCVVVCLMCVCVCCAYCVCVSVVVYVFSRGVGVSGCWLESSALDSEHEDSSEPDVLRSDARFYCLVQTTGIEPTHPDSPASTLRETARASPVAAYQSTYAEADTGRHKETSRQLSASVLHPHQPSTL